MHSIGDLIGFWLADNAETATALASRCGVHPVTVLRWKNGERRPRPAQLVALNEATAGYFARHGHGSLPETAMMTPAAGLAEAQAPFEEARSLGLDPGLIAATAIEAAIRAEKTRRWQEENRAAMDAQNEWVERHGLPLAKYRMF
jgi:antitoxin CcdA